MGLLSGAVPRLKLETLSERSRAHASRGGRLWREEPTMKPENNAAAIPAHRLAARRWDATSTRTAHRIGEGMAAAQEQAEKLSGLASAWEVLAPLFRLAAAPAVPREVELFTAFMADYFEGRLLPAVQSGDDSAGDIADEFMVFFGMLQLAAPNLPPALGEVVASAAGHLAGFAASMGADAGEPEETAGADWPAERPLRLAA